MGISYRDASRQPLEDDFHLPGMEISGISDIGDTLLYHRIDPSWPGSSSRPLLAAPPAFPEPPPALLGIE
jgi:hypothetical protein